MKCSENTDVFFIKERSIISNFMIYYLSNNWLSVVSEPIFQKNI